MTLKEQTVNGLIWSFIDNFASQAVTFTVGIILSRLLAPTEFGLIGMVTVFIAISSSFINSGFSQALIRKQNCTNKDYSTVFYFNIIVAIIFYLILFTLAPWISRFFKEPQLDLIIKALSIGLIIDSFGIIQSTTLNKRIDFKLQTKISLVSSFISGIVGIVMADKGFGVWSLVFRVITSQIIQLFLLWIWNKWRPSWIFSITSFKELFSFGSKLFLSGMIDTIYNNIYYIVIGKYFSAKDLGYYTRADMFRNIPSQNITSIMSRVTFPALSQMQDNLILLKDSYKKIATSLMLITFILMIVLAAVAEPLIITLIGEQWRPSIIYLQLLCFVGMLYPINSLNLNILLVLGRSDLYLKLEIIKKILAIPVFIIGIIFGIKIMILGMLALSIIAYYLNSYWSGTLINYSISEQIKDIIPGFVIALATGLIVYSTGFLLNDALLLKLILQLSLSIILFFVLCEWFNIMSYNFLKTIIKTKLTNIKLRRGYRI